MASGDRAVQQQRLLTLCESNDAFKRFSDMREHVSMARTVIASLAFTWSTVVLLGGFVASLPKKDFWCMTVISLFEAVKIFNDVDSDAKLIISMRKFMLDAVPILRDTRIFGFNNKADPVVHIDRKVKTPRRKRATVAILMVPIIVVIYIILNLLVCADLVFVALPVWRLWRHDYGIAKGDDSKSNLMPALDIFYSLVLMQPVLRILLGLIGIIRGYFWTLLSNQLKFPKEWAWKVYERYFRHTVAKCQRNRAAAGNADLISHATNLLGSESLDEYISGVRVLGTCVKQGLEGSSMSIRPSRPMVQKLIDTVGWRSCPTDELRELRELAAAIVSDFASVLHLRQFPGATRCISSLLETTHDGEGVTSNELVMQGLTILEKLALDHQNCRDIRNTPSLMSKIMAPIMSEKLIQEIRISPRAGVVNKSFKVLHRLICGPREEAESLLHQISSEKFAVSNLERILKDGKIDGQELKKLKAKKDGQELQRILLDRQELQMLAMEILTELVLAHPYIRLGSETKPNLISQQLQTFLFDHGGQKEGETNSIKENSLRITSGRTLALLSKIKENSDIIINQKLSEELAPPVSVTIREILLRQSSQETMEQSAPVSGTSQQIIDGNRDNFDLLTQMLDANNNIVYKAIAAEVLEDLCTHCEINKERLKEFLLPKVFSEIFDGKSEQKITKSQRKFAALGSDVESLEHGHDRKKSLDNLSGQMKLLDKGNQEQTAAKEFQEALLSLALRLYNLVGADSFSHVLQEKAVADVSFVAKLNAIVRENFEATPLSLRIVKLCGQIAMSMIQENKFTEQFQRQNFVESLSEASDIMSSLESCMLVIGTNHRTKANIRPLLSEIEQEVLNLVGSK